MQARISYANSSLLLDLLPVPIEIALFFPLITLRFFLYVAIVAHCQLDGSNLFSAISTAGKL